MQAIVRLYDIKTFARSSDLLPAKKLKVLQMSLYVMALQVLFFLLYLQLKRDKREEIS